VVPRFHSGGRSLRTQRNEWIDACRMAGRHPAREGIARVTPGDCTGASDTRTSHVAHCSDPGREPVRRSDTILLASALLVTACAPAGDATLEDGQPVGLLEYTATAPRDWVPTPTSNTMRLAEFTIGDDVGEHGEVVAYFFGAGQGGSVEANTERWTAQFQDAEGGHPVPDTEQLDGGIFPTTIVTLEGEYSRTVGMGMPPANAVPDQMLIAAVVETPRGNLYVQLHGPSDLVRSKRGEFLAFVRTIRPQASDGASG
jgi:hypothetical protein